MRSAITFVCVLFFTLTLHAVKLHDLTFRLSYEKHTLPGRLLRGDIDPPSMMVQAEYYYNGGLFNGTILDTSLEFIEAVFEKGKIVSYRRDWDGSNYYRYNVTASDKYSWYAVDAQFENGEVVRRSEYFLDAGGVYRAEINTTYPGNELRFMVERMKLGTSKGRKTVFTQPQHHGLNEMHYTNGFVTVHDYVNGEENGLFQQTDSSGRIIDRAYYSPDTGFYGEYIHVELPENLETRGQYRNGYATGVWITRDLNSDAIVQREWFSAANGQTDSVKTWYNDGSLQSIDYYPQTNLQPASRGYARNGQLIHLDYSDSRDTISVSYDDSGRMIFLELRFHGLIQQKFWNNQSTEASTERYFDRVTFYRDSVWRYRDTNGTVTLEKYYDNGRYLKTTVNLQPAINNCGNRFQCAAAKTVVQQSFGVTNSWDTSIYIPSTIIDSVGAKISLVDCNLFPHTSPVHYVADELDRSCYDHLANPKITYTLTLYGLDSCVVRDAAHCVTDNVALNAFLDSLKLTYGAVETKLQEGKKRKRARTVFTVNATATVVLNLSYVNRRLQFLLPGSRMMFAEDPASYPSQILYVPQGSTTQNGPLPFTVIGFSAGHSTAPKYKVPTLTRYYTVFIVYGDGEVESAAFGSESIIYSMYGLLLVAK